MLSVNNTGVYSPAVIYWVTKPLNSAKFKKLWGGKSQDPEQNARCMKFEVFSERVKLEDIVMPSYHDITCIVKKVVWLLINNSPYIHNDASSHH